MNIAASINLYFGGKGSGCNPEVGVCGRKPKESSHVKQANFANIKNHVLGTSKSSADMTKLMSKHGYTLVSQNDLEGKVVEKYKNAEGYQAKLIREDGVYNHLSVSHEDVGHIKEHNFEKVGAAKTYKQGSAISNAFMKLKSGQPMTTFQVFEGVKTNSPMQVLLRLQRHGEKYGWDVQFEGGKVQLKFSDDISPIPVADIKEGILGDKTALEVNSILNGGGYNITSQIDEHSNPTISKLGSILHSWKGSSGSTREKYITWMSTGEGTAATKLLINSIANGTQHTVLKRGMDIYGSKYNKFMTWVKEYHKNGTPWDMAASSFSKGTGFPGNIKVIAHKATGLDVSNFNGHKGEKEVILGGKFKIDKIEVDSYSKKTTLHITQIGKHVAV